MANSGAIKAGRAFVELFADDSKLVSGLKKAKAKLSAFGAGIRDSGLKLVGMGTALVAPMLGAAKAFAESGAAMEEMSKRTGISVESLSELSYAAQMSGLSMEDLEKALRKMQKMMGEAATSGKYTNGEWEVTYKLAASPNKTGITIGGITGIEKKGWEYLWVRFEDEAVNNGLTKTPVCAYVEVVYDTAAFSTLGI